MTAVVDAPRHAGRRAVGCERVVGRRLRPTNPFSRIYLRGSKLVPYTDRPHCQFSCSVTVAADTPMPWPLWLSSKAWRAGQGERGGSHPIALEVGDLRVYLGTRLVHWREPFAGERQTQLFFHYVSAEGDAGDIAADPT